MTDKIKIHDVAVYFCYTLGGCLFLFGKCGIYNMVISFAVGILWFAASYYLFRTKFINCKAVKWAVSVLCVGVVCFTFMEYAKFTADRILISSPRFAIIILFAGIIISFSFAKWKALIKFSFLFLFLGSFLCLIVIFAALSNFEFTNLECLPDVTLKEILRNFLIIFLPVFVPSVKHTPSFKSGLVGISLASLLITVFSLLTVCTFGRLNDMLDYPVLSLADTVNSGRIFTRLGLYLHAVIYVTGLIRCVVSLKKIKQIYN